MKNILPIMTDDLNQAFKYNWYDDDAWIDFQIIDLVEIEIPTDHNNVISILYKNEILEGSALYFTPYYNMLEIIKILYDNNIQFTNEFMDDGSVYLNFNNNERQLQTN